MITRFSVENFRNQNVDQIRLSRFNLLIGPNNSGKSNFLDALFAFVTLLQGSPGERSFFRLMSEFRWDEQLVRRKRVQKRISLGWTFQLDGMSDSPREISYDLSYRVGGRDKIPGGFTILGERLFDSLETPDSEIFPLSVERQGDSSSARFSLRNLVGTGEDVTDLDQHESIFNQTIRLIENVRFYKEFFPRFQNTIGALQGFSGSCRYYSGSTINPTSIRTGVALDSSILLPKADGSHFVDALANWSNLDEKYLSAYTERLREILKGLVRINIWIGPDKIRHLDLNIFNETYALHEMSDGTLRMMFWCFLLMHGSRTQRLLLAIDEPEVSIHPAWIAILGRWFLSARSEDQLFISTHSPDLLDQFTASYQACEASLLVFSASDKTSVRRVEPQPLSQFLNNGYQLGDLYRVGEPMLGGWPW